MSESDGRKLSDLRVVDLRAELEKRGLDKSGVKKDLVERLQKALESDGLDPETYVFESGDKKPVKRLSTSSSQQSDDKAESEVETSRQEVDASLDKSETQEDLEKDKENIDDSVENDKKSEQEDRINLTLDEEDNIKDENPEDMNESSENIQASDKKSAPNDSAEVNDDEAKESSSSTAAAQQDSSNKEEGSTTNTRSSEESPQKKSQSNPRLLWISNVPKNTRANELKQLLSAYGKVVCAKVVVNARFPGSCCFGYVTMGSAEDALNVISKLNNTEFNGQIIKIDKFENVKADSLSQRKSKDEKKNEDKDAKKGDEKEKNTEHGDDKDKRSVASRESPERRKSRTSDRSSRGDRRKTPSRERERFRPVHRPNSNFYRGNVLTFNKIKEERERQRMRDRERAMREDTRRRHEEAQRLREMREITRRQRSEAERLEREREKLRQERDKIEREKSELIKLERERQRIEREKLEMERMELQRSRLRLEEDRRTVKRPATSSLSSYRRDESFEHDRKRPAPERHFEEPPAPRFEPPTETPKKFGGTKDFKRSSGYDKHDGFQEKRNRDYGNDRAPLGRGGNNMKYDRGYDGVREREAPSRDSQSNISIRSKESSRYSDRDRSPHFRPMSDSRSDRHVPQGKSDRDHHYSDSNKLSTSDRWNHPITPQPKSFISSTQKPWSSSKGPSWRPEAPTVDRWNASSGASRSSMGQSFSSNSNVGPACPPPPGINNYSDRFEYNKSSNIRKY